MNKSNSSCYLRAGGLPAFKLFPFVKVEAKNPKGNAPIPNDI